LLQGKRLQGKSNSQHKSILELWKNADPAIPEVEDTKKKLANLKES